MITEKCKITVVLFGVYDCCQNLMSDCCQNPMSAMLTLCGFGRQYRQIEFESYYLSQEYEKCEIYVNSFHQMPKHSYQRSRVSWPVPIASILQVSFRNLGMYERLNLSFPSCCGANNQQQHSSSAFSRKETKFSQNFSDSVSKAQ